MERGSSPGNSAATRLQSFIAPRFRPDSSTGCIIATYHPASGLKCKVEWLTDSGLFGILDSPFIETCKNEQGGAGLSPLRLSQQQGAENARPAFALHVEAA